MHILMKLAGAGAIGMLGVCEFCLPTAHATPAVDLIHDRRTAWTQQAQLKTIKLVVDGMTCGGCALSARMVLRRLDGVEKAEISYENKIATVTYDPQKVTSEQLIKALKDKLGYTAMLVEEK